MTDAVLRGAVVLALIGFAGPVAAAQCELGVQGVIFGGYDPFSPAPLDSVGTIAVTCDVTTPFAISLGTGGGIYQARSMANGAHRLVYNLYIDVAHTVVWGDGSGGTAALSDAAAKGLYTVYGRIPARQNSHVGAYGDSVTVLISF